MDSTSSKWDKDENGVRSSCGSYAYSNMEYGLTEIQVFEVYQIAKLRWHATCQSDFAYDRNTDTAVRNQLIKTKMQGNKSHKPKLEETYANRELEDS